MLISFDLVTPHLGLYKKILHKDNAIAMKLFAATLFIISKIGNNSPPDIERRVI